VSNILKFQKRFRFLVAKYAEWDTVRIIGQSQLARYSIIVPIVGYFILFNENISTYLRIISDIDSTHLNTGPSWKIISTYYGLTFIAIGSIIYGIYCPKEIKEHRSDNEYIAHKMQFIHESELSFIENTLSNVRSYRAINLYIHEKYMKDAYRPPAIRSQIPNEGSIRLNQKTLYYYYKYLNTGNTVARVASYSFFIFGSIVTFFPSLSMFVNVTRYTLTTYATLLHILN